ncbi:MAG: NAD(+) diphosphatase [Rhodospirillales bacterium]|nr:NAD(+) diphosphatase [Rhodospirillales bacterium]
MADNLSYSGAGLDRVTALRRDDAWMAAKLADAQTRVVPVWQGRCLIEQKPDGAPEPVFVCGQNAEAILGQAGPVVLLGLDNEIAYVAADLTHLEDDKATALVPTGAFEDLRHVGQVMARKDASILAYARGMTHWHLRHLFCGVCGAATESRDGGHTRFCSGVEDTHIHFPRTDPAVIMLVSLDDLEGRGPACLLGRQKRWIEGMYSTLAGFVEPGETLEQAVSREVLEESGVETSAVLYQASQPWPFPSSLMLGFRASAETTAITVDDKELEDARWFTADEVRSFGEWGQAAEGEKCLPRKDSISRWLVDGWLDDIRDT